jgi:aspartate 1-decarboxylase
MLGGRVHRATVTQADRMDGTAAHLVTPGDLVIIMAWHG